MTDVRYDAPRTLARMLRSDAFVRCVVGPVGSGKSSGCIIELLRRAREQAPGPDGIRRSRWAVIRNTYRELEDTTRKTFEAWVPEALGRWYEQDFTFVMKFGDVEAEVLFRALDRPEHVKKLLSLELTGAYINELREVPKAVLDLLQARVGRYPSKKDGGPTWFGIWADTNPWHMGHWGYKLFSVERPEGFELYEQPSGLSEDAENVANLPAGYYERLCRGKDEEWVDVYVRSKYGASDRGSVYGLLLDALQRGGAVSDFQWPGDGVHVAFDLGISDATAMWFWRVGPSGDRQGVDFVDYYEASGKALSHFFGVLDERGYRYSHFWLPHDARARTLQTGESVLDLFLEECRLKRWGAADVEIGPELSLEDGIGAGRWLLEQRTRFHRGRCAEGLEKLREYRYEWDEEAKVFSKRPLHNFASHCADAYRGAALVAKVVQGLERPPAKPPEAPAAVPMDQSFTLEQLHGWAAQDRRARGRGRI